MKVLVTGANGFIGKNLCISLARNESVELLKFTRNCNLKDLPELINKVDFIFHLAGVNRPKNEQEFLIGNANLTEVICNSIRSSGRDIPIILSSSVQAEKANDYGRSKLKAEMHLLNLHMETGNRIYIYRLPNVFGKWCRPNYNSVVATFCHNIVNNLPIEINNPSTVLNVVHIGSVITSFLDTFNTQSKGQLYIAVKPVYTTTLEELSEQLYSFKSSRESLTTEPVGKGFMRVLYATYISYLSPNDFKYPLTMHEDERGSFVEMLKTTDSGQFSFFTAHPKVTRGGHYHHVKTEKFLVIRGTARFGFRHIVTGEKYEIITTGSTPEIVETVPGWSHDITNTGDEEMIVMLWANENFDSLRPDTVAHKV